MRLAFLALLAACAGPAEDTDSAATSDTAGDGLDHCGYTAAADLNPATDVVEINLTASALAWDPGTGVAINDGVAYDGSVPGPLIEANVGDTVIAHFVNDLDEPLTV